MVMSFDFIKEKMTSIKECYNQVNKQTDQPASFSHNFNYIIFSVSSYCHHMLTSYINFQRLCWGVGFEFEPIQNPFIIIYLNGNIVSIYFKLFFIA